MAKRDKYNPDYEEMYSGENITPAILSVLKQSDRKMKYMEVELKQGTFRQDPATQTAVFIPSREDSLERLQEEDKEEFTSTAPSPEEIAVHNDELDRLRRAMEMLEPEEYELIHSLYYEGISEETLAQLAEITQQGISWRLKKILAKIKKYMQNRGL